MTSACRCRRQGGRSCTPAGWRWRRRGGRGGSGLEEVATDGEERGDVVAKSVQGRVGNAGRGAEPCEAMAERARRDRALMITAATEHPRSEVGFGGPFVVESRPDRCGPGAGPAREADARLRVGPTSSQHRAAARVLLDAVESLERRSSQDRTSHSSGRTCTTVRVRGCADQCEQNEIRHA